jgi:hypothetical protein
VTKASRAKFREVKNLVSEGKEEEAKIFKHQVFMSERIYSDAVEAGRKLRKEEIHVRG